MDRLNRKIRFTLFVFLGIFSLVVNGVAFYIISDYNSRHFIALSKSHMEQQYQNYVQRMAVLGEQIRLFGDTAQFTNAVYKQDWSVVNEKLRDFIQSSGNIASLRIYSYEDGSLKKGRGEGNARYSDLEPGKVMDIWREAKDKEQSAVWFLRESLPGSYECLSYLMPVRDEGREIGFLMADINIVSFMADIIEEGNTMFEKESVTVVSPDGEWYRSGQDGEDIWGYLHAEETDFEIQDGAMFSIREVAQSRDRLIQVIPLKMNEMLYSVGGMLSLVFLISLAVIYFGVRFISGSIMNPLKELKHKMNNTLEQ